MTVRGGSRFCFPEFTLRPTEVPVPSFQIQVRCASAPNRHEGLELGATSRRALRQSEPAQVDEYGGLQKLFRGHWQRAARGIAAAEQ